MCILDTFQILVHGVPLDASLYDLEMSIVEHVEVVYHHVFIFDKIIISILLQENCFNG